MYEGKSYESAAVNCRKCWFFSSTHTVYCPVGHLAAKWALGCWKCFQHCLVTCGVVSVVHESLFLFWITIGRWTSKKTLTMGKQVFDSSTVTTVRKFSFAFFWFFFIALPQTSEATDRPQSPQQLTQWIYWIILKKIPIIFWWFEHWITQTHSSDLFWNKIKLHQYYRKGKFEAVWKSRVSFLAWLEMFFCLFELLMSLNPGWLGLGIRSFLLTEASQILVLLPLAYCFSPKEKS